MEGEKKTTWYLVLVEKEENICNFLKFNFTQIKKKYFFAFFFFF